jgi:hypothetical protein
MSDTRSILGPEIVVIPTEVPPPPSLQSDEYGGCYIVQVLNLECALLLEPKFMRGAFPSFSNTPSCRKR